MILKRATKISDKFVIIIHKVKNLIISFAEVTR